MREVCVIMVPAPSVSQLMKNELMSAVDIKQLDTFKAATLFAQAEGGIIPGPRIIPRNRRGYP